MSIAAESVTSIRQPIQARYANSRTVRSLLLEAIHVKEDNVDVDGRSHVTRADHDIILSRCNPQRGDVLLVNVGVGVATAAQVDMDFAFSVKNVAPLKPEPKILSGLFPNYCLI